MDSSSLQRLIKKMLDSSDLMPETREELEEYLTDLNNGTLHADDASYIEGLARRLGYAEGGAPPSGGSAAGDDDGDSGFFPTDQRASDTAAAVQAEMALRKVEQARALLAQLRQPQEGIPSPALLEEIDKAHAEASDALQRNA